MKLPAIKTLLSIKGLLFSLAVFTLFVYVQKVPLVNVGYADSDEFLAVAYNGGVAHPPGYIWYTMLLWLFMRLPIPQTTPTFLAHFVSAVSVSTSFYVIGLATYNLLMFYTKQQKMKADPSLLKGSVIIGLVTLFSNQQLMTYALITEKYAPILPILGLAYLAAIHIYTNSKPKLLYLVIMLVASMLLVTHHQAMVFFLPFIGYVIWVKRQWVKKHIPTAVISILIPLLLWAGLLYWRLNTASEPTWRQSPGIQGLIEMATRESFRGTVIERSTVSNGYLPNFNAPDMIKAAIEYTKAVFGWFYWWIIVPLVIGIFFLYKRNRILLIMFGLPVLLTGILLASYLTWPADVGTQGITERFFIPSVILFLPLLAAGIFEIITRLSSAAYILGAPKKTASFMPLIIVLSLPLFFAYKSITLIDFKKFDLPSRMYSSIIESVESDSIITCYSDTSCFALLYEQTVLGKRPDVTVVPLSLPLVDSKLQSKKLERFGYEKNPFKLLDIVTWNIDKRPVYAVDISQYYFTLFGLDNGLMYYVPKGYYGQLVRKFPGKVEPASYTLSYEAMKYSVPAYDHIRRFLVNSVAQTHYTNAYMWLKLGEREQAQQELNTGVSIAYRLYDEEKKIAQGSRTTIEKILPDKRYGYGKVVPKASDLTKEIPTLLSQGRHSLALFMARGGIIVDPLDVPSRLELAKMYVKMGDKYFAKKEFSNILTIDPNNAEAKDYLKNL